LEESWDVVFMTTRDEAERLLSTLNDDDIVEIDEDGRPHKVGTTASVQPGKPVAGISDAKGEYDRASR
jgi:hypothetical protein